MKLLKIQSSNVRGLGDYNKRRQMFHYFHTKDLDVVFAQETHSSKKTEKLWKSQWGGQAFFSHGESNAKGVAIFIRKKLQTKVHKLYADPFGRYLIIDITIGLQRLTLCNVYGPNTDDLTFFDNLFEQIESFQNADLIIAGDFNTLLNDRDKKGNKPTHPKSSSTLIKHIETHQLIDIWREFHPNEFQFTWKRIKPKVVMERIDFFLVSETIAKIVTQATIQPSFKTDHSSPQIIVKTFDQKHGPGYWKLNTSYLDESDFVQNIKNIINEMNGKYQDIFLRWEMMKLEIRGYALKYGARKTKSNKLKLEVLARKKNSILSDQANVDDTENFFQNIHEYERQITLIDKEIDEIMQKKSQFAMMKCKEQFYDGGEKCTVYFFNLE